MGLWNLLPSALSGHWPLGFSALNLIVPWNPCSNYYYIINLFVGRVFLTCDSILLKGKFVNQFNVSFGSGGMTSALESNTLVEYFQYVQRRFVGQLPIKRGVLGPGFYKDVFVANEKTFISADGEEVEPCDTNLVWLNRDVVFEQTKIRCSDITPTIVHPRCRRSRGVFPSHQGNIETQLHTNSNHDC